MNPENTHPSQPVNNITPNSGPIVQPPVTDPQPPSPTPTTADKTHHTNAGMIVLQWLTYAFWGWTVLALSSLTVSVLVSFFNRADTGEFTPYAIGAVLVLLPISFVCDLFYSKKESLHKTGAEMAVMVIHAVLFALFGIGALIAAVFTIVSMLTSAGEATDKQIILASSLIIFVYYAATFVRVLNPPKMPMYKKFYGIGMLISVGIIVILGIVGPVAKERALRNDRLIENNLGTLQSNINSYANAHSRLPSNLAQLDTKGDVKVLIDKNLVEYKPENSKSNFTDSLNKALSGSQSSSLNISTAKPTLFYQLCVTYKHESPNYSPDTTRTSYSADTDGYSSYISVYDHPAGRKCYKAKTDVYAY